MLTAVLKAQNIGATIGYNMANVSDVNVENQSFKYNLTLGFFTEFMLSDKIGLQPEIVFSGQGFKFTEDDGAGVFDERKQKISYMNVPVLLNYYLADNFYVQAGPYFGILTNAKIKIDGLLGGLVGVGNNKDDFNNTDFGAAIGLGIKSGKFDVGLRYQQGISNIQPDFSIKNRVVNISLGYRFFEK